MTGITENGCTMSQAEQQSMFSDFTVENMEKVESAKSIAESNFIMCSVINIQGFHDKEILRKFYGYFTDLYRLSAS